METSLDNPVIKDDAEYDALREMAQADDRSFEDSEVKSEPEIPATGTEPDKELPTEPKPDNPETKAERDRDEEGRFKAKTEAPQAEPPQAPQTPYEKAKKERERQESLLKNFNQEKEQFRQEAEQERQRIAWERQQLQEARNPKPQLEPLAQNPKFTTQDLIQAQEDFAKKAEQAIEDGDAEGVRENLGILKRIGTAALQKQAMEYQAGQEQYVNQCAQQWTVTMQQEMAKEEAFKDPKSPLAVRVGELLSQEPIFERVPDGFAKAVAVAKLEQAAASVSGLTEENKNLRARLAKYEKDTQIESSSPTTPSSPKSFGDGMSLSEMENTLRSDLEAA